MLDNAHMLTLKKKQENQFQIFSPRLLQLHIIFFDIDQPVFPLSKFLIDHSDKKVFELYLFQIF